jgi:hypothetical protein
MKYAKYRTIAEDIFSLSPPFPSGRLPIGAGLREAGTYFQHLFTAYDLEIFSAFDSGS